ncbi:MAG: PTPDL family protein, partial [Verrucomicrobiales bacterium]
MSTGPSFPIHRLLAVFWILLTPALWADKVYLKSGDVITGTILEETPDVIRIQVIVGTIKDNNSISRVSIDHIEKTTPEDVEHEACVPLRVTPDGLSAKGYEDRLKVLDGFLAKYPTSKYLADVQSIRNALTAELERVKSGETRFRGNWLSAEQQVIHAPNLEAHAALRGMRQAAAARNYLGALRQFEIIEKNHTGSLAYPEAVTEVKRILPAYGQSLTKEIDIARYDAAQNAKGLATLNPGARASAEAEIAAVNARYKAQVEAERTKKMTWLSVDLKSEASITEAIERVKKEIERIGKIDIVPHQQQAQAFYDAGELISAGKLDEATVALAAAAKIKGGAKITAARTSGTSSKSTSAPASGGSSVYTQL